MYELAMTRMIICIDFSALRIRITLKTLNVLNRRRVLKAAKSMVPLIASL